MKAFEFQQWWYLSSKIWELVPFYENTVHVIYSIKYLYAIICASVLNFLNWGQILISISINLEAMVVLWIPITILCLPVCLPKVLHYLSTATSISLLNWPKKDGNHETFYLEYISKSTIEIYHSLNKILVLKEINLFWCKFNKLMSLNKVNAKQ